MSLAFECTTPNKYWEGQYGLATYLSEIRNQIDFHDNWRVAEIFLEEDWKGITLERLVEFGAPPYEATEKVADISGRPVDKFAEPFNTKHWNVGNRIHDLGNGKVRVDPTTVQTPNPFFKN
jgi:hypothetical protein